MKKALYASIAVILIVITGLYFSARMGGPAPVISTASRYTDTLESFSFLYPKVAEITSDKDKLTQSWRANTTLPGILLVRADVPRTFEPQTNFAGAYFTVGVSADRDVVASCHTEDLVEHAKQGVVSIGDVVFTTFETSDAGAGNFYETMSYRTTHNGSCFALEYTIHSTNIGNYSPDQGITAFDHDRVRKLLEGMVDSFEFGTGK